MTVFHEIKINISITKHNLQIYITMTTLKALLYKIKLMIFFYQSKIFRLMLKLPIIIRWVGTEKLNIYIFFLNNSNI